MQQNNANIALFCMYNLTIKMILPYSIFWLDEFYIGKLPDLIGNNTKYNYD